MTHTDDKLSAAQLEERLDELLDAALSLRRTATGIAVKLARHTRVRQKFALHWTGVITKTNPEMAYQFADFSAQAFDLLDFAGVEDWIIEAMDVYDKKGMYPAIAVLRDVQAFAERRLEAERGVGFGEIAPVLELVVQGLSGRHLNVVIGEDAYTDTEHLFLPERLARFGARASNLKLYKAMAIHQWAQGWFGTFRAVSGSAPPLTQALAHFPDPERALHIFHRLEAVRLDACIRREFPGLGREFEELRQEAGDILPPAWLEACTALTEAGASVSDTIAVLERLYHSDLLAPLCYQGQLFPERVEQTMAARQAREKKEFQAALARLVKEQRDVDPETAEENETEEATIRARRTAPGQQIEKSSFELEVNGRTVMPNAELRSLMESILQDLGEIPDDYLVAAGDGAYTRGEDKRAEDVWKGTYHEQGAFLYNEWDYRRKHYRKDWCVLREIDVHPADDDFVRETLRKHAGLAASLRKTFEALRGENRILRRQKHGDDIDIDAVVDAYAELRSGREASDDLFLKFHKVERNIAVLFMVDMSGSTKGWINDAEREALVLLCEALEILGDRYAIYGFSGTTRKRCELYRVKRFDEPYSDIVRARIAGIKPQDYTRMGVTIRHMTHLLRDVEARTKLLITLSDGKPDDYDGYRGDYGIEDTRQALLEAKQQGVHAFCITIDAEARDYLPHMYGHANYALIDDVRKLPLKISDIYRHLTS